MKRFLGAVVGLALLVLAVPSHAQAADAFSLTLIATCDSAGASITNNTGSAVDIRIKFDGVPMFGGTTYSVDAGQTRALSGVPSASTGVITVVTVDGSNVETFVGNLNYEMPSYCDDFTITYTENCDVVTIHIVSTYPSATTLVAIQTDGSTFPIDDVEVPANGSATLEIPLTPDIQEIRMNASGIDGGVYLPGEYDPTFSGVCVVEEEEEEEQNDGGDEGDGDSGAGLPDAGSETTVLAALAALVLAAGAGLTVAGRRRAAAR